MFVAMKPVTFPRALAFVVLGTIAFEPLVGCGGRSKPDAQVSGDGGTCTIPCAAIASGTDCTHCNPPDTCPAGCEPIV